MKTKIQIITADGRTIHASIYGVSSENKTQKCVIINSALGVKRIFYDDFAQYLVSLGHAVITWDARSVGESAITPIQSDPAKLSDWGEYDLESLLNHVEKNKIAKLSQTTILGHSAGAQIIGLSKSIHKVRDIIIVSSGLGYWKLYPFKERFRLVALWYILLPLTLKSLGYFPANLAFGHDLPQQLLWQWRSWCLQPHYLFSDQTLDLQNYETYSGRISAIGFSDDNGYSPKRAALELLEHFPSATKDFNYIQPSDFDLQEIGHFGFFKKKNAVLWPIVGERVAQKS